MIYNIDEEITVSFDFDYKDIYKKVVDAVLDYFECPYDCEVSLLLVDDEKIHEINEEMRGIDSETDVLSFPNIDLLGNPAQFDIIDENDDVFEPDSGELIIGDIVLNRDRIISQALEYGHSELREYAFLICHSMLHLIGFDHIDEGDRREMEKYQDILMDKLGIRR